MKAYHPSANIEPASLPNFNKLANKVSKTQKVQLASIPSPSLPIPTPPPCKNHCSLKPIAALARNRSRL